MKDTEYLEDILNELKVTMIKKHEDYGPYSIANAPGGAMNGLMVRMHDKMARLENLHYNRIVCNTPNYEPLEDNLLDLANYAIIGLMVQRGFWEGVDAAGVHKGI